MDKCIKKGEVLKTLEILKTKQDRYVGLLPSDIIEDIKGLVRTMDSEDVVPVVRCKDCKHGEVDDDDFPMQYLCHYHGCAWNNADHFCSYGERKEADGNG